MKTIYSNFDTIIFVVKGALKPCVIERLRLAKASAEKDQLDKPIRVGKLTHDIYIKPTGQKGGYAFVLDMGSNAQIISLKDNLSLTNWNGYVKIRAMSLALKGYEKALEDALQALSDIGFKVSEISMNHVDYAIDVLTPYPIELDPNLVVTHSRRQVKDQRDSVVTVSKGRQVQSITIGKMPSSQIIIYDKIAEVTAKKNFAWYKIWGIERDAKDVYIKRVEIRAGKTALKADNITTIEALNNRIRTALKQFIAVTRYVVPESTDSNISRRANHPLWNCIANQIESGNLSVQSGIDSHEIELIRKEAKAHEYKLGTLGYLMVIALCHDIPFENISDVLKLLSDDLTDMQREGSQKNVIYTKKYAQAQDRLRF